MEKMMAVLDRFVEIQEENDKQHKLNLAKAAKRKEEFFKSFEAKKDVDCENPYAKRLLECGVEIYDYLPIEEQFNFHDASIGSFYCKKGNYIFEVMVYDADYEFPKGSLRIDGLYEEKTRNFFDLSFEFFGTGFSIDSILFLLENGTEPWKNKYYGHYVELPKLLKEEGYNAVVSENFDFSPFQTPENPGNIRIEQLYIKMLKNFENDTELVLTNNPNLDLQSYFAPKGEFSKTFPYNSNKDFKELCKCIDACLEKVQGKYGYLENNTFYKGEYVVNFFKQLEKQMKENNKEESWIGINPLAREDGLEEDHYKGIDICEQYMISCNESMNVGDVSSHLVFGFVYDKNVDKENVNFSIQFLTKTKGQTEGQTQIVFECQETFTTCFSKLQSFVQAICEFNQFEGMDVFKKDVSFFEKN